MSDRAKLPCRGEQCKDCPQTECLSRIMSDDEEKPMVLTEDLLKQVLTNQMALFGWIGDKSEEMAAASKSCVLDTDALLERLKTS